MSHQHCFPNIHALRQDCVVPRVQSRMIHSSVVCGLRVWTQRIASVSVVGAFCSAITLQRAKPRCEGPTTPGKRTCLASLRNTVLDKVLTSFGHCNVKINSIVYHEVRRNMTMFIGGAGTHIGPGVGKDISTHPQVLSECRLIHILFQMLSQCRLLKTHL